jgi:transcription initiation factor TFIID subunit 6
LDADGNLPDAERHRQAALASVKEDQAMAGVLVYFVKWLSESVGRCLLGTMGTLGCLVDCMGALLRNESVFLEPYVS